MTKPDTTHKRISSRNVADRRNDSYLLWIMDRMRNRLFITAKKSVQRISSVFHKGDSKCVIFVSGVQRSGTNLVMDTLERSFQTEVFHESDPRAFENYELRGTGILRQLVKSSGARFVIFKSLCESHDLGRLLDEFEDSKALWVYRDFQEVVRSHVRLWSGMPDSIDEIISSSGTAGWRGREMSAETLAVLKKHCPEKPSNEMACAMFWYLRNIRFFEQKLDEDPRVMLVPYSAIIKRPREEFSKIFKFLGIGFIEKFTRKVAERPTLTRPDIDIDPDFLVLCRALQKRLDSAQ